MRVAIAIAAAMMLAGCQTDQVVVSQKQIVVQVPEGLWNCPLPRLPEVQSLTDAQVASLISQLYKNNVACRQSIDAVRQYIASARGVVEQ